MFAIFVVSLGSGIITEVSTTAIDRQIVLYLEEVARLDRCEQFIDVALFSAGEVVVPFILHVHNEFFTVSHCGLRDCNYLVESNAAMKFLIFDQNKPLSSEQHISFECPPVSVSLGHLA